MGRTLSVLARFSRWVLLLSEQCVGSRTAILLRNLLGGPLLYIMACVSFFLFYSLTQRTNVFCRVCKGTCGWMSNGRRLMKDREGLYEILNEHVNILAKGRGKLQQDPA